MWWRERQIKKSHVIGRDVPTPPSRRTCQLQLEMAQVIHPINFCNSMRTPKQAIYHLPCSCRSFPPPFTNWISLFLFKFHWLLHIQLLHFRCSISFSLLHISFVAAKSCYIICGCAFVLLVISFFLVRHILSLVFICLKISLNLFEISLHVWYVKLMQWKLQDLSWKWYVNEDRKIVKLGYPRMDV